MTRLFQNSESKVRVSAKKGYTKEEKLEILQNTSTKERYHDELNNNMLKKIVQVVCCGEKRARLSPACATTMVQHIQISFERFNGAMSELEVFVETITLFDELEPETIRQCIFHVRLTAYVLFPLPETCFLCLDLISKLLPEFILFLPKFGIFIFLDLGFTEFARLHLLLTIIFIVNVLSCRDEIQHEGTNQEGPKLLEVAVALIFNYIQQTQLSNPDTERIS